MAVVMSAKCQKATSGLFISPSRGGRLRPAASMASDIALASKWAKRSRVQLSGRLAAKEAVCPDRASLLAQARSVKRQLKSRAASHCLSCAALLPIGVDLDRLPHPIDVVRIAACRNVERGPVFGIDDEETTDRRFAVVGDQRAGGDHIDPAIAGLVQWIRRWR